MTVRDRLRLGARVDQLRRDRQLTQVALAAELGYSLAVVKRLFAGHRLKGQTQIDVETWVSRHRVGGGETCG